MPGSTWNGFLMPNFWACSRSLLCPSVPARRTNVELQDAANDWISGGEPLHRASSPSALWSVWPDSGSRSSPASAGESLVSPPLSSAVAESTILNEDPGGNVSFIALLSIGLPDWPCSRSDALTALALSCVARSIVSYDG